MRPALVHCQWPLTIHSHFNIMLMSLLKEKTIKKLIFNNMQGIVAKIMSRIETRFRFNSAYIDRDCISIFHCLHVAWGRLVKTAHSVTKLSRPTNRPPARNSVVVSFFTRWYLALGLFVLGGRGTYNFWKSGKIGKHFSSQGKVREFDIFFQKSGNFWWHNISYILMAQNIFITACSPR